VMKATLSLSCMKFPLRDGGGGRVNLRAAS
jgi:hypothetical protein